MLGLDIYYALGVVSGEDQGDPVGADFIEALGKKNLLKYKKKGLACSACPIACAPWVEIPEGPYKGLRIKGIEIISTLDFGARLGVRSMPAIARATELFQKYGLDCSTASAAIALAIKLFENGIITKADTDGMELKWGDEPSIFEMMRKITYREGFGDLLAEGPVRMARKIGKGAEEFLTQTRGLETTARDPRGRWDTWSFGSLINPRGGDHLRVQAQAENFKDSAPEGEYFYEQGIPKKAVDPVDILPAWKEKIFDFEKNTISIPHMAAYAQDHMNVVNSIGICIRPPILWSLGPTIYSRLLQTLTGLQFTPEDVMKAGERISTLGRLFNARAGKSGKTSASARATTLCLSKGESWTGKKSTRSWTGTSSCAAGTRKRHCRPRKSSGNLAWRNYRRKFRQPSTLRDNPVGADLRSARKPGLFFTALNISNAQRGPI